MATPPPSRTRAVTRLTDSLSRFNRRDDFGFTVATRSSLRVVLNGIQRGANVDLFLLNSRNRIIGRSARPGRSPEVINQSQLDPGTYTLRAVLRGRTPTPYRLTRTLRALPIPDFAGNSRDTARVVSLGSTPTTFRDYVGPEDTSDYYTFTLGEPGSPSSQLQASLARVGPGTTPGSMTVRLRDGLNNVIESKSFVEGGALFDRVLAAGTYFVEVVPASGRSDYRLTLSATSIPDGAGNEPSQARLIPITLTPTSVTDFVGPGDEVDYYTFRVGTNAAPTTRLNLGVAGANGGLLGGDVRVVLRDELNREIRSITASKGTIGVQLTTPEPLATGNYFIEVRHFFSGDRDPIFYTLTAAGTPVPDLAGNTPTTARPITLSSTPLTFNDFVGIGDSVDYYRFTATGSTFNATMTGPNGNPFTGAITLGLEDALNRTVTSQSSVALGGAGITLSRAVTPGATYFVKVEERFNQSTDYVLRMSNS